MVSLAFAFLLIIEYHSLKEIWMTPLLFCHSHLFLGSKGPGWGCKCWGRSVTDLGTRLSARCAFGQADCTFSAPALVQSLKPPFLMGLLPPWHFPSPFSVAGGYHSKTAKVLGFSPFRTFVDCHSMSHEIYKATLILLPVCCSIFPSCLPVFQLQPLIMCCSLECLLLPSEMFPPCELFQGSGCIFFFVPHSHHLQA